MANLKEIQTRIGSVTTTRQVTSAMKMVSAAKLKKAQDHITQMRPYAEKLLGILGSLTNELKNSESVYYKDRIPEQVLIVLVTSNKGLCGGFNSNLVKHAIEYVKEKYSYQFRDNHVDFLVIGKQGAKLLKSRKIDIKKQIDDIYDEMTFENVSLIADNLMQEFASHQYDIIELAYNRFKNAAVQIPSIEQFLPIADLEPAEGEAKLNSDFIFEPSKAEIVEKIIPQSLRTQLFKVMLDSAAADHGARMTAMTQATDNATDLIQDLTLTYNKARQTAITNQIIEVTGGAEALN